MEHHWSGQDWKQGPIKEVTTAIQEWDETHAKQGNISGTGRKRTPLRTFRRQIGLGDWLDVSSQGVKRLQEDSRISFF